MIDTGAAVSLVRGDLWSTIPVKRVATLEFLIAGTMMKAEFLVTDQLSSEAILDLDFLDQNKCTEQHSVHINGNRWGEYTHHITSVEPLIPANHNA